MIYRSLRAASTTQGIKCTLQVTSNSQLIERGINTLHDTGTLHRLMTMLCNGGGYLSFNYIAIIRPYVPRILNYAMPFQQ